MLTKNMTMRELLTKGLGIGNFNATMLVQYMFMAPATTDPKSPSIIMLVKAIQQKLNKAGAGIVVTGYLDVATANAMVALVGPGWESRSWGDNVTAVLSAGQRFRRDGIAKAQRVPAPEEGGGLAFWDPPILPAVPGGILTYGVAGLVLWNLFKKKR